MWAKIDADVERARHMQSCVRMLLTDGLRPLATAWGFSEVQVGLVREQFSRVVGPFASEAEAAPRSLAPGREQAILDSGTSTV